MTMFRIHLLPWRLTLTFAVKHQTAPSTIGGQDFALEMQPIV